MLNKNFTAKTSKLTEVLPAYIKFPTYVYFQCPQVAKIISLLKGPGLKRPWKM